MPSARFSPGFRLSLPDALVLLAGAAAVALARRELALIAALAVGHFFLFCNVFRVRTRYELAWAAGFVPLVAANLTLHRPGWPATAALSLLGAAVVIVIEMRGPGYHGIGWRRINPRLPEWWNARQKE